MVPSVFMTLEALPLTPSGKIDRRALPPPGSERADLGYEYEAPRTEFDAFLARLWQELLEVDRVGIYDNFFDLCGHSLLAVQATERIESEYGVHVNPQQFIFQTLAQVAKAVEARVAEAAKPSPTTR